MHWTGGTVIFRDDLSVNEEFLAWEQPLFAPAAGTVVYVENDLPDNVPSAANPTTAGNAIQLEAAPGEFLLMIHLRQGSVAVTSGEQVKEVQFLARIGNSGFSAGPHLHMQLQNAVGLSLPFRFKDLLVNGKQVQNPSPAQGDFVQHAGWPTPVPAEYALPPERSHPRRAARSRGERPLMTKRSAEWLRSPATVPLDLPPLTPWHKPQQWESYAPVPESRRGVSAPDVSCMDVITSHGCSCSEAPARVCDLATSSD
jgi:hypothetical protein